MHLKRNKIPKTWPIPRKGSKYILVANHSTTKGIPLAIILRDILKLAKTKREARKITLSGQILVNNKIRKDEKFPIQLFDIIQIPKLKKNYKLIIENKKFKLIEIQEKESDKKIVKIIGKKSLKGNKVQINLEDGQNFITKEKFSVGDSAIINTKQNKIEKILPLRSGNKIEIIAGKHAGEVGIIKNPTKIGNKTMYEIKLKEKTVKLPLKSILVIE